jgi:hypothetical protein
LTPRLRHGSVRFVQRAIYFLMLLSIVSLAGCRAELQTSSPARANEATRWSTETEGAWVGMQRHLVGRWRATTPENRTIATSYRVVSNSSALVETFTSASGKETLSVYHRDGRALMLTHYCAQGNQARLKAIEATNEKVVFTFLDATNVTDQQGVMHRLAFLFRPDGFDQESTYRNGRGEEDATTLHFVRE